MFKGYIKVSIYFNKKKEDKDSHLVYFKETPFD